SQTQTQTKVIHSRYDFTNTIRLCYLLGAGFAFVGLFVAWHYLENSSKELNLRVDLYDAI
ncbi:hypothetical protein LINPERPRIM_LOCUS23621, partial [Linum perenne]